MRGVSQAMMSSKVMKDVAKCRINSIACGIMYGEPRERMSLTGPHLCYSTCLVQYRSYLRYLVLIANLPTKELQL